ncbi:hypothetical protein G7054_g10609 [Neopestalotiopsis clavispora]|nr:hypothetical protein G7054_g10609 [Neopestalotiopsis clavispora]
MAMDPSKQHHGHSDAPSQLFEAIAPVDWDSGSSFTFDHESGHSVHSTCGDLSDILKGPFDKSHSSTLLEINVEPRSTIASVPNNDSSFDKQGSQDLRERLFKLATSNNAKTREVQKAEKARYAAKSPDTVARALTSTSQSWGMLPKRSWRIQLTMQRVDMQRVTEAICPQNQACGEPVREHTASSSHNPNSDRSMATSAIGVNAVGLAGLTCTDSSKDQRLIHGSTANSNRPSREHLFRKHMKAKHCRRCWATFKKDDELTTHQRENPPCPVLEEVPIEGLDASQVERLRARKTFTKMKECTKWRKVYVIIFPDVADDQIPLPYYVPEDFYAFPFVDSFEGREAYLRQELPTRITDVLLKRLIKLNIDHNELKGVCEEAVSTALASLSRSTPEQNKAQNEPRTIVTPVASQPSSIATDNLHDQSQEQAESSMFSWDPTDFEHGFDALIWNQSVSQNVGIPDFDFLSEDPG